MPFLAIEYFKDFSYFLSWPAHLYENRQNKRRKDKGTQQNVTSRMGFTTFYVSPFLSCIYERSDIIMNAKPASRHSVVREGQQTRPTVKEENSELPTFTSLTPSSPTMVMVSVTSVSPLLYASPNISRQMASLINTDSDIRKTLALLPSPDSYHTPSDSQSLQGDRDDGNCVCDGKDAPDDDPIRRMCRTWAREE